MSYEKRSGEVWSVKIDLSFSYLKHMDFNICGLNIKIDRRKGVIISDGELIEDLSKIKDKIINITIQGNVDNIKIDSCDEVIINGKVGSISTVSGDVKAKDVSGDITTVSGDVTAKLVEGNIKTVSGDIDVV